MGAASARPRPTLAAAFGRWLVLAGCALWLLTSPTRADAPGHSAPAPDEQPSPLTLEQAISRALKANRGLADSADAVTGSGLSLVAANAEFELKIFPSGQASLSGSTTTETSEAAGIGLELRRRLEAGTQIAGKPFVEREGDTFRTGISTSLEQPLLKGLSREANLAAVHGAEFSARTARRSLYLAQVNTIVATVSAVYDIVRQRELVDLNRASVKRLQGHAKAARAKEKLGLATGIDVYRASIQLKQAEDNLAVAREALADARDSLAVLLALPLDQRVDVRAPLTYSLIRVNEREAVQLALEKRVELDQSEDTLREARRRSRVARHNTLPDLNVSLNYRRYGQSARLSKSAGLDEDSWTVGLSTTTDLARTAEHAALEQSLLSVRAAHRSLDLRRDETRRQVKRELRGLRRAEKRIAIQQDQIKHAGGKLALARVKLRRGVANNFDVIEAETELRGAQTSLLSAVIDYVVTGYRLRAAMGTLAERPRRF